MSRLPREEGTRDKEKRGYDGWKPPALLPIPMASPGIAYRYIRTSTFGDTDVKNVSSRFREGWVPVKAEDHPELEVLRDPESKFKDGIEIGGLLLCQTSTDNVDQRNKYYGDRAQAQMDSVDQAYLRANDPRMPLSKPERRSRTTFGSGR
jgi:hypothetical protein